MLHKKSKKNAFRRWELALLLGLALSLLGGTRLSGEQAALADRVIRLHVIGASNSAGDQAVKLRVRDAVLKEARPLLEGALDRLSAEEALIAGLSDLAQAGADAAGVPVIVRLEKNTWFPTKGYVDISLPAGRYTALQVHIGEGKGRNWWGVIFPDLCTGAVAEDTVESAGVFTPGQIKLLTGDNEVYEVKCKALEVWDRLTDRFS